VAVVIDSGVPAPTDRFSQTPPARWHDLLLAKRQFLETKLQHDCRCLIEFVEEAEDVWEALDFSSAEEMICEGYELDPIEIDLAVAWLKHNEQDVAIGLGEITAKISAAKDEPLNAWGNRDGENNSRNKDRVDNVNPVKGGNSTDYTLRRLARDCPEMLDRIESGELSVNAAAIAAGIRKVDTPDEKALKALRKADNPDEVWETFSEERHP